MAEPIPLMVQLAFKDGDAEELERLTRQLSEDLRELDVERVEPVSGGALPEGAKGVDPMLLGMLAVWVGPVLLPKFLDFLHAWAMRREGRTVKVKLQKADGSALEVEVPATMSRTEVKTWVNTVSEALAQKPASKKTRQGRKPGTGRRQDGT
jgi:hypothetical protein